MLEDDKDDPIVGDMRDCSGHTHFIDLAGSHALDYFYESTGYVYGNLSVHSLNCQRISSGIITQVAASAVHPVTMDREYTVVLAKHNFSDGSSFYTTADGHVRINPKQIDSSLIESQGIAAVDVDGTTGFTGTPITNAVAFRDKIGVLAFSIAGYEVSAKAVFTGIIIIGTAMLLAIVYAIVYYNRHPLTRMWHFTRGHCVYSNKEEDEGVSKKMSEAQASSAVEKNPMDSSNVIVHAPVVISS